MATPIDKYLNILAQKDGSDLYLSTGAPPCAKFQGTLKPLSQQTYQSGDIEKIARAIMDQEQNEELNEVLQDVEGERTGDDEDLAFEEFVAKLDDEDDDEEGGKSANGRLLEVKLDDSVASVRKSPELS